MGSTFTKNRSLAVEHKSLYIQAGPQEPGETGAPEAPEAPEAQAESSSPHGDGTRVGPAEGF